MKKNILFLSLLVFVVFGLAVNLNAQSTNDLLKTGEELSNKWDYKGAVSAYEKILAEDAANYDALWKIADNYIKLGVMADTKDKASLYEKAANYASKAVEAKPDKAEGHIKLAIAEGRLALFRGGKIKVKLSKSVKKEAEKALEINPNSDQALHTLGAWHREVATLSPILKVFAKIIYGGLPPASREEAVKYLEKSTSLAPNIVENHLELGRCYMAVKKYELAKKAFEQCLTVTPTEAYDGQFKKEAEEFLDDLKEKGI